MFEGWRSKSCGLEDFILGWASNQLSILLKTWIYQYQWVCPGIGQIFQEKILESPFWNIKSDYQNTGCWLREITRSKRERVSSFRTQTFFFKFYLFIYLFLAVLGLRFCARAFSSCGKRGPLLSQCAGLSPSRPLLLRSTGSRRTGSAAVAHGPNCSAACGILPDQGSNPCPVH